MYNYASILSLHKYSNANQFPDEVNLWQTKIISLYRKIKHKNVLIRGQKWYVLSCLIQSAIKDASAILNNQWADSVSLDTNLGC